MRVFTTLSALCAASDAEERAPRGQTPAFAGVIGQPWSGTSKNLRLMAATNCFKKPAAPAIPNSSMVLSRWMEKGQVSGNHTSQHTPSAPQETRTAYWHRVVNGTPMAEPKAVRIDILNIQVQAARRKGMSEKEVEEVLKGESIIPAPGDLKIR
jgi:hypothetical protein